MGCTQTPCVLASANRTASICFLGARRRLQEGVVLDAFEQLAAGKVARSTTVILVKNIPFSTTDRELRALFVPFGPVIRVVLPPARTIALVEFAQPSEARSAFRHLAYTKFKVRLSIVSVLTVPLFLSHISTTPFVPPCLAQHLPLYLEWAPMGTFSGPPPERTEPGAFPAAAAAAAAAKSEAVKSEAAKTKASSAGPAAASAGAATATAGSTTTGCVLFVKNLAFATTEDTVRATFEVRTNTAHRHVCGMRLG